MYLSAHVQLLASYNEWMNTKLYEAAAKLPPAALSLDRNAFFKSIIGTLSHLVVTDIMWLKRFALHPTKYLQLDMVCELPTPTSLDQILFDELAPLRVQRTAIDSAILAWSRAVTDSDLVHVLRYANSKGVVSNRLFFSLVMHLFNHQTHHRGQATTLLTQAGVDVGITDLLVRIPNAEVA